MTYFLDAAIDSHRYTAFATLKYDYSRKHTSLYAMLLFSAFYCTGLPRVAFFAISASARFSSALSPVSIFDYAPPYADALNTTTADYQTLERHERG